MPPRLGFSKVTGVPFGVERCSDFAGGPALCVYVATTIIQDDERTESV
jgi:hypothetical protein